MKIGCEILTSHGKPTKCFRYRIEEIGWPPIKGCTNVITAPEKKVVIILSPLKQIKTEVVYWKG